MNLLVQGHLARVQEAADNVFTLKTLSRYVEKYVRLEGKPYKFGDRYGFQAIIIDDDSRVTNTVKPAQIGLTTANMAYLLAGSATQPRFNSIYSLPTTNDAQKLVVTKLDPMIQGSPEVKRLLNVNVNNNELKQIGNNFIFIRGSKSETAALSISADCLVADEIDRSDPDTLKQFRSRLQASDLQIIKQFSTPTIEGVGIAKEAETSKRYRHFAKCAHCNHIWLPSYHTDVRIPGFIDDLREVTKTNIKNLQWQDAHWQCPSCGKDPQLHPKNLQWICENPTDNYEAATYYVSPVTACLVLKPAYLVRTSTEFNTRSEWANQVLGETSEEENEQIVKSDIDACEVEHPLASGDVHYMGCDMGLMCAVSIGRMSSDGIMLVVHRELVPLHSFHTRRLELIRQYHVICSVHDTMPYVSDITRICDNDYNAYGAIFVRSKTTELFTITEKHEDEQEGKLNLRLVKTHRTLLLDMLRDMLKSRQVVMSKTDKSEEFKAQYLSLKRVQQFIQEELVFNWVKTDGEDHMLFSLGYLLLAIRLRGKVMGWTPVNAVPMVSKFVARQNL